MFERPILILIIDSSGFSDLHWAQYLQRRALRDSASRKPLPEEIPLKQFKQKHPSLPLLKSYGPTLPDSFWQCWHRRDYASLTPAISWIRPGDLQDEARRLGYRDVSGRLQRTLARLREGADIGCRGPARLQTKARNSPSAYEYGARVMDTIQGWVKDELCYGPLKPEEMPFKDYTVNPIVVKLKPTGAARVCINQSAPYKKPWHEAGAPSAVNSGVNKADFPTSMGSTRSFAISLYKAGCPAEMTKIDWNQGIVEYIPKSNLI